MTNKLMDVINNVGNNIKQNVAIYSTAGLMALATSCGGGKGKEFVEFDGNIGKDYVFAARHADRYGSDTTSNYIIEQYVNAADGGNGELIVYFDKNNDTILDRVRIEPLEGDNQTYYKGSVFDAAQKMYMHLRDTMPEINLAAGRKADDVKSASDATTIDKYFK